MSIKVTVVFDIGKTNKKILLFDEEMNVVHVEQQAFKEVKDDEGFFTENIDALESWIDEGISWVVGDSRYDLESLNFSTYGASIVHIDEDGNRAIPFINYLKPLDQHVLDDFFRLYGSRDTFSVETASPVMGFLNSGFQLYYLKHFRPSQFDAVRYSLHFPQYLSYRYTKKPCAEYTSIGCHTVLWDYNRHHYHDWLAKEKLAHLLPDPAGAPGFYHVSINNKPVRVGVGIHDSSSALLPYRAIWDEPFVLISTGTWSICMNPFNNEPLTFDLLKKDCLNFLSPAGTVVRASRLFLGKEFTYQIEKLCAYFMCNEIVLHKVRYDEAMHPPARKRPEHLTFRFDYINPSQLGFKNGIVTDYSRYETVEEAYYQMMDELTDIQVASLRLAIGSGKVATVFVDGGFSDNHVFLGMMARKMTGYEVYAATVAQGSALGAALMVNESVQSHLNKHAELKWIKPEVQE